MKTLSQEKLPMLNIGCHQVPGIWRYLLPDDFQYFRFPKESQTTCSSCPNVKSEGYHPDYRCCTYHPWIPNFLIGSALNAGQAQASIVALISDGLTTPEGLIRTPQQTRSSLRQSATNNFGKNAEAKCRFIDKQSGKCQMYANRNAVCATFFCINDQKLDGREFWARVQGLISQIETALAQWAMTEIGFSPTDYFQRFNSFATRISASINPDTDSWSEEFLKTIWADWYGRESEFFAKCAQLIYQHKEDLYTIACQEEIIQPTAFDIQLRKDLPDTLRKEYDVEGAVEGTPLNPKDLWYQLQVAYQTLWQNPSSDW